jgi:hypothetical protein
VKIAPIMDSSPGSDSKNIIVRILSQPTWDGISGVATLLTLGAGVVVAVVVWLVLSVMS